MGLGIPDDPMRSCILLGYSAVLKESQVYLASLLKEVVKRGELYLLPKAYLNW